MVDKLYGFVCLFPTSLFFICLSGQCVVIVPPQFVPDLSGLIYIYIYFDLQNHMGQLLEIVLIGGTDKVIEQVQLYPVNSLVQLLPIVSTDCDDIVLDDQINCCLQGVFSFSFLLFLFLKS